MAIEERFDAVQIRAVVGDTLTDVAPDVDVAALDPDADLYDEVGLDSMDILNLATGIHERVGVDIAERDYPKLTSLNRIVAHVESLLP